MSQGLIEVRDDDGKMIGYKCSMCSQQYGLYEHAQALACLENHRTKLVEG